MTMDYLTKWPEAQAVSNANAEATANFLYETIICQHGDARFSSLVDFYKQNARVSPLHT